MSGFFYTVENIITILSVTLSANNLIKVRENCQRTQENTRSQLNDLVIALIILSEGRFLSELPRSV